MIEDIKGYKPHTDDKITVVNEIKEIELVLGTLFKRIEKSHADYYIGLASEDNVSNSELDEATARVSQIRLAKERLKEASMWACRSVFQPEEKY
ncbi:hypothetical protein EBPHNEJP_00185 [Salmonella phage CF-SP2]|nr:hypothetical protein EBPHNEJP_00185 [Salmonella phage CF-SP2]